MLRIGRFRLNFFRRRPVSNRTQILIWILLCVFVIGIHETFIRYKPDKSSDLTKTILTAVKGSSHPDYFTSDDGVDRLWIKQCEGNFNIINRRVLLLRDGKISGLFMDAKQTGGDDVEKVLGQPEDSEFVAVKKGFIQVPCGDANLPQLNIKSTYEHFIKAIKFTQPHKYIDNTERLSLESFAIVIERKDYANVYWTMIEMYNAFLTARMFSRDPSQTCVFLLDVHPRGKLDDLWSMVFGTVQRVKDIKTRDWNFRNLVFGLDTYSGPITTQMESLPFISELQATLYRANGFVIPPKKPCSFGRENLNITLILRRNYVAHARNPSGKIKRKLANEKEIIDKIRSSIPFENLKAVQLDDLSVKDQVKLIYHTDILIGVHGAGLGHVILMRPESGLIELFPTSYFLFRNRHFEELADWVGVQYSSWYNSDVFFTDSEWMYVSPQTVVQLIKDMARRICSDFSH
ncbi:uncharacterized protein LOC132553315 [Ylistrum balloti]|uniref:uncharacterized protein LOC132553315 n=1 Tax=Ylistrum balloti TaxID=509963 RepID=UPI002905F0AB|nr:uncharacterized protein LOC132553315 [Ylistrum balloti]